MTTWVHGAEETSRVEEASRIMFGGSLDGVQERTLELLAKVVPVVEIGRAELANGIAIVDLLSRTVADSKSAARRLLQQGGAYINNVRITDSERRVTTADLATATMLVVRGGRKDYRLVKARDGTARKVAVTVVASRAAPASCGALRYDTSRIAQLPP